MPETKAKKLIDEHIQKRIEERDQKLIEQLISELTDTINKRIKNEHKTIKKHEKDFVKAVKFTEKTLKEIKEYHEKLGLHADHLNDYETTLERIRNNRTFQHVVTAIVSMYMTLITTIIVLPQITTFNYRPPDFLFYILFGIAAAIIIYTAFKLFKN